MQNKVCNTCKIEKDPSSFYKKGNSLYFECKECAIRRTKEIRKRKHPVNLKTELGNTYLLDITVTGKHFVTRKPVSQSR